MADEQPDPEVETAVAIAVEQQLEQMFPGQPPNVKALALTFFGVERLDYFYQSNFANSRGTAIFCWPPETNIGGINGYTVLGSLRPPGHFTDFLHFCLALAWLVQSKGNNSFDEPYEIRGQDWVIRGGPHGGHFYHRADKVIAQQLYRLRGGHYSSMLEAMANSNSGTTRAVAGIGKWIKTYRTEAAANKKRKKAEKQRQGNQPEMPQGFGPQGMSPGMPGMDGPQGMPPGFPPMPPQG